MTDNKSQPSTAREIYDGAQKRAQEDHIQMVDDFMAGRIDIAQPCFDDRLREYLIVAFDGALAVNSQDRATSKGLTESEKADRAAALAQARDMARNSQHSDGEAGR